MKKVLALGLLILAAISIQSCCVTGKCPGVAQAPVENSNTANS